MPCTLLGTIPYKLLHSGKKKSFGTELTPYCMLMAELLNIKCLHREGEAPAGLHVTDIIRTLRCQQPHTIFQSGRACFVP